VIYLDYPEKELVRKSKHGDIEAFETLIMSYEKKIFNIALGMAGNFEDAGDIAQEVCIKIFKNIKSFKEDSSFGTWVYRITSNTCIDEIRKRSKVIPLTMTNDDGEEFELPVEDREKLPDEAFETKEKSDAVRKCILDLPLESRAIIVLRDIRGFSYDEISRILSINMGTVKSRLNRARNILKDRLKNTEPFKDQTV
jgi:RNA polymerase sigma factor, sigma-70 family